MLKIKVIGLLGGMSWESSLEYYRIINEIVKQRLGGLHSAKCILYSVDFEEIEMLQNDLKLSMAYDKMAEEDPANNNLPFRVKIPKYAHSVSSYLQKPKLKKEPAPLLRSTSFNTDRPLFFK